MGRLSLVCLVVSLFACGNDKRNPNRADGGGDDIDANGSDTDAAVDARPDAAPIVYPMGALVRVTTSSQVGVLLEDFPVASRTRLATAFAAMPQAFWMARAKHQI